MQNPAPLVPMEKGTRPASIELGVAYAVQFIKIKALHEAPLGETKYLYRLLMETALSSVATENASTRSVNLSIGNCQATST